MKGSPAEQQWSLSVIELPKKVCNMFILIILLDLAAFCEMSYDADLAG
jgi:hypothetical protein